ncbi:hypothetical protein BW686_21735 [Pseudomonas syringae]|uniref:Uncharacterized protein n=1 Tax=Pseudomonas syringae TaxID=317 RepID=A0A244ELH3_PSESX|nr:hypothetical protein BW686_21735 [Pseudomonas syringae]
MANRKNCIACELQQTLWVAPSRDLTRLTRFDGKQILSLAERDEYSQIIRSDQHRFARLGALRQLLDRLKVRIVADLMAELDVDDR